MCGGVGDLERGDLRGAVPEPQGGLGVAAEGDDGLQSGVGDQVVEAVAPRQLVGVGQQREGFADLAGVDREREGVDQGIAAGQPELGEEPLDPLARVPDQGAADETFGGSWVGGDSDDLGGAVEPAAVEHRAPVVPEQLAVFGGDGWQRGEVADDRDRWPLVELDARWSTRVEVDHRRSLSSVR